MSLTPSTPSSPTPFIVGLTGGIGSGKSTAGEFFQQLGITVIDADDVAREVVEPGSPALQSIQERFGQQVIQSDGHLDRRALRAIIFTDPQQKVWLEQLTHPLIRSTILQRINASRSPYTLLISPLLFEAKLDKMAHKTLLIDLPVDAQVERAAQRDDNSHEQIQQIIAQQMSREERQSRADIIIVNDQTPDTLRDKVGKVHEQLLEACALQ